MCEDFDSSVDIILALAVDSVSLFLDGVFDFGDAHEDMLLVNRIEVFELNSYVVFPALRGLTRVSARKSGRRRNWRLLLHCDMNLEWLALFLRIIYAQSLGSTR